MEALMRSGTKSTAAEVVGLAVTVQCCELEVFYEYDCHACITPLTPILDYSAPYAA